MVNVKNIFTVLPALPHLDHLPFKGLSKPQFALAALNGFLSFLTTAFQL